MKRINNWGSQVTIPAGGEAVLAQVHFPDDQSQIFHVVADCDTATLQNQIRIEFGSDGVQHNVLIDVKKGCAINVPASFVRVIGINAEAASQNMRSSIAIGNGEENATVTYRVLPMPILSGTSLLLGDIFPKFSKKLYVSHDISPASGFYLRFINNAGLYLGDFLRTINNPASEAASYLIPSTATGIKITNNAAGAIDGMTFVFSIKI